MVELNRHLVKEQTQQESALDRRTTEVQTMIDNLVNMAEKAKAGDRRADELLDRLDERRAEMRQLQEDKQRLIDQTEGFMSYANDRERIIANAMDVRTIIETDEPQVANTFVRLFVKKLVIKDHIGTIHFTVPHSTKVPNGCRSPFGLGKHLFARPLGVRIGCIAAMLRSGVKLRGCWVPVICGVPGELKSWDRWHVGKRPVDSTAAVSNSLKLA